MKQKRTTTCRVWLCMALMLATALGVNAQGKITLKLTDEPLPKALRLIEQQGSKSIIFSVSETEKYKVSADIRDTTQAGAISHVLWGKPFVAKERPEYFVVQKQESKTTAVSISGVVVDEKGEPMPSCNVRMFSTDSIFLAGTITDSDGVFNIEAKENNEYLLKISFIGYEEVSKICQPGNLGETVLHIDNTILEDIVIKASEKHQDAITETFFLTDSLRNSANNSLQLLEKLNGISIDWMSDAVKVGEYRDVPIMVNGREVGKNLVKNLNPKRIKKIELLRYPKGKYGDVPIVLNFITYENYLGYDVGIQTKDMLAFRPSHSHRENIGTSFIYTLDKWNIYSEIGINNKDIHSATSYRYLYKGETSEETAKEDYRNPNNRDRNQDFSISIGADYKISPKHTFALQSWLDGGYYLGHEKYMKLKDTPLSENNNQYRNINSTSGLFYRGEINNNLTITSDFTYNYYAVDENRLYKNMLDPTELNYSGRKDFWRYNLNANSVWSDMLSSNIGYTYTNKSYTNTDKQTSEELFRSFENRHDIYALLMVNPFSELSLAVGSNILFVDRGNGIDSDIHYSWMPSAKLFWQPWKRLSLSGNYFCDVAYPNLDQLSTITYNKNQLLLYRGNPNLQERVMHYMEWRINIPKIIQFTYMLKHSANDITPWYYIENVHVIETLIGSKYHHQYFGVSGDYNVGQKANITFTANYQRYGRKGTDTDWKMGHTWYLDAMASCQMSSHFQLLSGYFLRYDRIPLLQGEEYGQEECLMLGAMSSLCKGKISLAITFAIPTSVISKRAYRDISIPDFRFTAWEDDRVNNALVQINFRYNIGKGRATKLDNQNRSETEKF